MAQNIGQQRNVPARSVKGSGKEVAQVMRKYLRSCHARFLQIAFISAQICRLDNPFPLLVRKISLE